MTKIDRRKVINRLLYAWTAITSIPIISGIIQFIIPPKKFAVGEVVAGQITDFQPNSARIIKFGERPVIILTDDDGSHTAYSANCTHLGCVVKFREEFGDIYCACHGSVFDRNGVPQSGPASRPLESIPLRIENNNLIVYRV